MRSRSAQQRPKHGDVPIGAVVLDASGVSHRRRAQPARASTLTRRRTPRSSPCATPRRLGAWRLDDCTLVVTLEPCTMCAGAVVQARVGRLVFGAWNDEMGAVGTLWDVVRDRRLHHRPEVVSGRPGGRVRGLAAGLLRRAPRFRRATS